MTSPPLFTRTSFDLEPTPERPPGPGLLSAVEALLSAAVEERTSLVRRLELLGAIGRRVDTLFQLRAPAFRATPNGGDAPALVRRRRLRSLLADAHALWAHVVLPTLRERDIAVAGWTDLHREDRQILTRVFSTEVSPLLTPLTVDAAHPFPAVASLALNVAVLTRDLRTGTRRYIGIEIPPTVPRFLRPRAGSPLVPLESVIGANLPVLLPGLEVVEQHTFRVTRDGRPLRARGVAEGLGSRTRAAVRLEVDAAMSAAQRLRLVRSLGLEADDVDPSAAPLDLAALTALPLTHELSRTRGRPVRQPVANPPSRTPDDGAA